MNARMNAPGNPNEPQQMPQPTPQPSSRATTAKRTIVAVTAVVGGVALVAVGASATYAALSPMRVDSLESIVDGAANSGGEHFDDFDTFDDQSDVAAVPDADGPTGEQSYTMAIDGVSSLDLEIGAADFTLAFGDVSEAELTAAGPSADAWKLAVDEGQLSVETPNRGVSCLFNCADGNHTTATLTLPKSLSETGTLDADISLEGGALQATGSFRELELSVDAGEASIDGEAQSAAVDVEAGKAVIDLAGVRTAEVEVAAGSAEVNLTGKAPDRVAVNASTGRAVIDLPQADYRVDIASELGEVKNQLSIDESSKHAVSVRAEAAQVTLK